MIKKHSRLVSSIWKIFFETTQIVLLVLFYLFISNRILLTVYETDCKQYLFFRKFFVNFIKQLRAVEYEILESVFQEVKAMHMHVQFLISNEKRIHPIKRINMRF